MGLFGVYIFFLLGISELINDICKEIDRFYVINFWVFDYDEGGLNM